MIFDVADLHRRLASRLSSDATGERGDFDLSPHLRHLQVRPLRPAAVLVPIIERVKEPTLLLTQRADHLAAHAAQVAFPGGRIEPEDASPAAAALREAEEEIGLSRSFVRIVGALDTYETGTGFRIHPIVGLVREGFTLMADPNEVARIFEVPLVHLMEPGHHERRSADLRGGRRDYYAIPYKDHNIWGATAGMIVDLYRKLYGS